MRRYLTSIAAVMATALAADIPIRQIVLYKNGVGYFERGGPLAAGEPARLDFKAGEMNDVLMSLTVEDKSGAKITGIRYDSSEPLESKLAEFPFRVNGAQPLSAFLDQMKGAHIDLKYGAETLGGAIVSARLAAASEKSPEREQVVLLTDSGELRTLDLTAASSIRFADPKQQALLRDYLTAMNQALSKDKRSVYIDSSGEKSREISASYMVPMPVWKSSYRLILREQGDPTLEGWAIVDNTTGEDWSNVHLAVVSGRPVSFISRLYEARFLTRPIVDLPGEQAVGPMLHEGAMEQAERAPLVAMSAMAAVPPPAGMPRSMGALGGARDKMKSTSENMTLGSISSVASTAEGRELGDLFEYSFAAPVTVKKNESAMLPFLQQKLSARKLLIYSENYGQNPMSAAELTNSTGKTLDGGPIAVFDASDYSGEALMETLRAGDKRLISYAVDLGTRITTKFDSTSDTVREIHAQRGVVTTKMAAQETKTFTIRNVDAKPKTLVIEYPHRQGFTLLNEKPAETTPNAYRFEVKLGPGATEKFPVSEERVYQTSVAVSNQTPETVLAYLQNRSISAAGRTQLQHIADLKRQIASATQQLEQAEAQIAEIVRDQDRIRQNLVSLNSVSGQQEQVQKYSRQLADQEAELAKLRDGKGAIEKKRVGLQQELDSAVERLEF